MPTSPEFELIEKERKQRAAAIVKFAREFFRPGDVIELRVLNFREDDVRKCNLSGYFDYDHIEALADQASRKSGQADGVYWTINPLKEECLERRANRLSQARKGESTFDQDVRERRWVVIDIDSNRPDSKLSATEDERIEAMEGEREIRVLLRGGGWDAKHAIDSGNGVHLYYECDPQVVDQKWVDSFLHRLARKFPGLKIDASVGNPARIMRIPFTKNCKGKPTKIRPHRYAKMIEN